jgi:RsiW-degrading membrane proteinase PrsW (M82 family)
MDIGIVFKFLAALLLTFIWAVYLRKVSIFNKIRWVQVIFPLIIGGLTTQLVLYTDLPDISIYFNQSNKQLQDFIFFMYNIALYEEFCKFLGFFLVIIVLLVVARIAKKRSLIEEPNIIIYASLVALGFAAVENFIYFNKHGISLIYMRGMMSTVSHIIGTSIIAGFLVVGYRKSVLKAILYTFIGLMVATLMHGFYNFLISRGYDSLYILTLVMFSVEIEVWSRILNNFLNFSIRIYPKKSFDRNTLQKFLFLAFIAAGGIQLVGLLYEEGWKKGFMEHLSLLSQELIITIILVVRITRFTIVPRYWQPVWPVLPISIRRGKFQRSIIPTSPRFFLKIKGDEFNEYPFTSRIDQTVKLGSMPNSTVDFDLELNVKMLEKKFIGPKKELYYLCEILDFHTIHPQYNSRYILLRPKNFGKKFFKKLPIVGLIALKGFVDLDKISPKDCKFINWMVMKKEGEKTPHQRMLDMLR